MVGKLVLLVAVRQFSANTQLASATGCRAQKVRKFYVFGSLGRDWLLDFALRDFFFDYDANPTTGDRKN